MNNGIFRVARFYEGPEACLQLLGAVVHRVAVEATAVEVTAPGARALAASVVLEAVPVGVVLKQHEERQTAEGDKDGLQD